MWKPIKLIPGHANYRISNLFVSNSKLRRSHWRWNEKSWCHCFNRSNCLSHVLPLLMCFQINRLFYKWEFIEKHLPVNVIFDRFKLTTWNCTWAGNGFTCPMDVGNRRKTVVSWWQTAWKLPLHGDRFSFVKIAIKVFSGYTSIHGCGCVRVCMAGSERKEMKEWEVERKLKLTKQWERALNDLQNFCMCMQTLSFFGPQYP